MPRHQHIINDVCSYDSSSSEELYSRIRRPRHGRHGSVASSHHHHHVHEPAIAGQHLAVPVVDVGRKRASSASGLPQPNIIINTDGGSRSRSRERARPRSRSGGRRYEHDDDMFEEIIERRGRISRSPSPYYRYDHETRKALERLSIFEREKAEEEAQERYKAELEVHKAKEQLKKEKEKELAKKAVDDWHKEQAAKKEKARKEKEEQDKLVEERLKELIGSDAYEERKYVNERRLAHSRPTYIKVHRRYLLPETLNVFELPWSYDSDDSDYILIKQYVSNDLQDQLFAHTKKIKSRKLIEPPIEKQTILKVNDRKKDKMFLVRKKDRSPGRFLIRSEVV